MRKYIDYMKIGIKEHLVYSSSVFANLLSKIIYLYMQFSLWNALFSANPGRDTGLSHEETLRYIIVATIISTFMECDVIAHINNEIQTGNIANQLIRPMDFRAMVFSKNLGTGLIKLLLYCIPLCIITGLIYHTPVVCRSQLIFGLISVTASYMIQFFYSLIIGLMAFWLIVTWPLNMLLAAIYKLLSGSWIPVQMFPGILERINTFLPFRAIYAIPVTIITAPMERKNIYSELLIQLIWIIILYLISLAVWKTGRKKLVVQGG